MVLPIGFFMPLPLPIMIPFMMWQSAAIAAGFGTMFQYAKRKVSAMSNDEFNASRPTDLVNELFNEILTQVPSSFEHVRSMNTLILQSMSDFLEDAIRFLSGKLGGQLNQGFQFSGPPTDDLPNLEIPNILPPAFADTPPTETNPFVDPRNLFPPAPPPTQSALLQKYANFDTYRSKGGLLTEGQWKVARRGLSGGISVTPPKTPTQGKIKHPSYVRTLQNLLDEKSRLLKEMDAFFNVIKGVLLKLKAATSLSQPNNKNISQLRSTLAFYQGRYNKNQNLVAKITIDMKTFIEKFRP